MEIKRQTATKISLFGAVMIILGAMIGVGIFFKNGGVFENNNGNSIGVLVSWIISSIIAFSTIFCYSEIVTAKTKVKNSGLAGWSDRFCGYRIGRAVQLIQPLFYYAIYVIIMCVFCGEAILNCFSFLSDTSSPGNINLGDLTTLYIVLIGIGIFVIMTSINYFSLKTGANIAKITTIAKFVPLLLIIGCGLVSGIMSGGGLWTGVGGNVNEYSQEFDVNGIFMSIPAILFAFDSFLVVGNIHNNVENPKKNVPLSVVVSMVVAIIMYMLITIAQITIACGNPYGIMEIVFGKGTTGALIMDIFFSILMLVAIVGSANSFTISGIRSMQAVIDARMVFGHKWFNKISNGKNEVFGGTILLVIISIFYVCAICVPSIIINNDQILDGFGTLIVLFFFFIYATVILGAFINRKTQKVEVTKTKGFRVFAVIGMIGCYFTVCYCAFYQFLVAPIMDPYGLETVIENGVEILKKGDTSINSWGLFVNTGSIMTNAEAAIVFWVAAALFIGTPFINDLLIKWFDKSNDKPLIWEKYSNSNNSI